MSIIQDIEAALLASLESVAQTAPPPYGTAIAAVLAASKDATPMNVVKAILDVLTAIDAVLTSEKTPAPAPEPAAA